jgi:hypothetical protein
MPAVSPVQFTLDAPRRMIRIVAGRELSTAVHDQVVAIQADEVDPISGTGWSVSVIGQARRRRCPAGQPTVVVAIERLIGESWRPTGQSAA